MARILLGVTGGIAAYKALEFTRLATKAGHAVRVIQTEASTRFVGTASFAAITGAPVLITEWEPDALRGAFPGDPAPEHAPLSHLALVERADLFLIAPASANTIAKLAHGAADNLLTAAALACRRPLIVAPAMNDAMYEHAATRANLADAARARRRGARARHRRARLAGRVGRRPAARARRAAGRRRGAPRRGRAAGRSTASRCSSPPAARASRSTPCASSATARRARWAGRWPRRPRAAAPRSRVVAANVSLPRSPAIEYVDVSTAAELGAACAERFPAADVLLMAAAVADYRPASARADKIKKTEAGETLALELERTDDVLSGLAAQRRPGQLLIGFAAESGDGALAYAREKLERKRLDAVVVNDVSRAGHRLRRARQRGHDRHRGRRAARPASVQGGDRGRDT